jgi:hypothetical protein
VLPINKKWEIATAGDGIFKVILPTKDDMASLKKIKNKSLTIPKLLCTLRSGLLSKQIEKWGLYDIWV